VYLWKFTTWFWTKYLDDGLSRAIVGVFLYITFLVPDITFAVWYKSWAIFLWFIGGTGCLIFLVFLVFVFAIFFIAYREWQDSVFKKLRGDK
jgi:hypothetical protein